MGDNVQLSIGSPRLYLRWLQMDLGGNGLSLSVAPDFLAVKPVQNVRPSWLIAWVVRTETRETAKEGEGS